MTDAELIRGIQEKDAQAWTELYRRYVRSIWRYAYALTNNSHLADDMVSEAMLALVKHVMGFPAENISVYAWLRCVVRNKVHDFLRQEIRRRRIMASDQAQADIEGRHTDDPVHQFAENESLRMIAEILDELPELPRIVLEWKYMEGLSVRVISERLELSENAVQSALYRARREFRQRHEAREKRQPSSNVTDLFSTHLPDRDATAPGSI